MRKFRVVKGYRGPSLVLDFGSTVHRPTGTGRAIEAGTVIELESVSYSGNVWFQTPFGRGKAESGSVENMIRAGVIEEVTV